MNDAPWTALDGRRRQALILKQRGGALEPNERADLVELESRLASKQRTQEDRIGESIEALDAAIKESRALRGEKA